jgi:hypothetical protein
MVDRTVECTSAILPTVGVALFLPDEDDTILSAARKRLYLKDAMRRWPWLTIFECLNMQTEEQLIAAVQRGSSQLAVDTAAEVTLWLRGKTF